MTDRADPEDRIRAACAKGDHDAALTGLVEAYGDEVYGFLVARIGREDAASEVFAVTLEKLWRGLPRFAWRSTARGWMYAVGRNAMVDHLRGERAHRHDRPLGSVGAAKEIVQRTRTRTDTFRRTATKDRFRALRERLPPEDQTLLVLRVDRGLSWRDLAFVMEPDEPEVDRVSARLRQRFTSLKRRLAKLARAEGML